LEPPRNQSAISILLAQGVSGLSVAFDLPTQIGYDPITSSPPAVGRVGVAIDSIKDMSER
jgi:methylmalonyl-CoA mutase N-terminal domain/subunit